MSLFAELKRRNVFRVAIAYLALGWIVTQVISTLGPMLNLPPSVGPIVFWIFVAAFPFVLLFSWIYELTPEGLKKESEIDRTQSITHATARKLDYLVIALLVVAIALYAFHEFRSPGSGAPAVPTAKPGTTTGAPSATEVDRSIAVLPFVNMSADKDQEYFADGISEEVLNLLTQVPQLRVIARTSSFSFKGKEVDIAEIAKKLNVAHVLEGSVRKSGDKVRITAQLVRASDSSHLWSGTYDRQLEDVFAVQDEIAATVVAQMKITLLGAAPKSRVTNPQAYAKFLQALQLGEQVRPEAFAKSNALYQEVLATDPDYVEAWRKLATNSLAEVNYGLRSSHEGCRLARDYVDRALAIDPDYGRAHDGLAMIALMCDLDPVTAARESNKAQQLDPTNDAIRLNVAFLLVSLGRAEQAIPVFEDLLQRDPVSATAHLLLAVAYGQLRRIDDAIGALRTSLSLSPGQLGAQGWLGILLQVKGDTGGALAAANAEPSEMARLFALAVIAHAQGKHAESDAALEQMVARYERPAPMLKAMAYAARGENDRAFEWLEKSFTYRDSGVLDAAVDPWFGKLHDDPRWLPFLRKHGIAAEQLAAIRLDVPTPK